jgi:hypothetical protein
MKKLVLNVKREYFEQIRDGSKTEEYRLVHPYWRKRLEGKHFSNVEIRCGYPKNGDTSKIIRRVYCGWYKKTITHHHFGDKPVEVFAIPLTEPIF